MAKIIESLTIWTPSNSDYLETIEDITKGLDFLGYSTRGMREMQVDRYWTNEEVEAIGVEIDGDINSHDLISLSMFAPLAVVWKKGTDSRYGDGQLV